MEGEEREPLLPPQSSLAASDRGRRGSILATGDTALAPASSDAAAPITGAAAADGFITEFGPFQGKVSILLGAGYYYSAGWILLPVFVNPQLQSAQPDVFTTNRLALMGSAFFAGWSCGAPIFAAAADKWGRKRMGLLVLPPMVAAGCMSTLPPAALSWLPAVIAGFPRYYALHLLARGLLGFCIGGLACFYIWMMEWLPGAQRAAGSTALNCVFALVAIGLAGLAALLHHHPPVSMGRDGTWPILQFVSSLPMLIFGVLIFFMVPESPRWLLSVGRITDAEASLRVQHRSNTGTELPHDFEWPWRKLKSSDFLGIGPETVSDAPAGVSTARLRRGSTQVDDAEQSLGEDRDGSDTSVWTWRLIGYSLVQFLCWFTATLVYYGLGYSAESIAGDVFVNSMALSAADIPGNLLYVLCADSPRFGRRGTQVLFFVVGGVCLVIPQCFTLVGAPLPAEAARWLAVAGKLVFSGSYTGIYVIAAEIYPASVRTTGMGCCLFFARAGGVLAPQALQLDPDKMAAGFGVLGLASGLATLLLPETLGRALD